MQLLGHEDGAGVGQLHPDRLMPEGVARGADDHHAAVAEQVIVAIELEVGEITRSVIVGNDMRPTALEFLRPPRPVQLLFLMIDRNLINYDVVLEFFDSGYNDRKLGPVTKTLRLTSLQRGPADCCSSYPR